MYSSNQPLDYYGSYDFENGDEEIFVPIKLPTLITLSELLNEYEKTKIEKFTEALKKDSDLCIFIENYFTTSPPRKRNFAALEKSGKKDVGVDFWAVRSPRNPIVQLMQDIEFSWSIAERVGNDEELVAIAEKILKPFRQDSVTCSFDAQEYSQTVDQYWENKIFIKALREELVEYAFACSDISSCKSYYVEEPLEDRIARIKTNPSLGKVFEGGDGPLAKLCGAQSILFGYWVSGDLLVKLAELVDSPDLPKRVMRGIEGWLYFKKRSLSIKNT